MTDATLRIKNLSIALEALSRSDHTHTGDRVFILLTQAITEAEEEQRKREAIIPGIYKSNTTTQETN